MSIGVVDESEKKTDGRSPDEGGDAFRTGQDNAKGRGRQGYPSNIPFPMGSEVWTRDQISGQALDQVHLATVQCVQNRIDWYDRKANRVGWKARTLRFLALVLVGVGALAPLVDPLLAPVVVTGGETPTAGSDTTFRISLTSYGYVAIALGGILVGFDNFFGLTETWMRFRLSQAELVRRLTAFRYEWVSRLATYRPGENGALTSELLVMQRLFVDKVEATVETETATWASRLRVRWSAFDRKHEFESYEDLPGRVRVRVDGWSTADADRIALRIGAVALKPDDNGTALSPPLMPGRYTVRVERRLNDGSTNEQTQQVEVTAEKTAEVTIDLPSA